uniref:Uncharacterized protein n=1 Tax=Globodera rostochiensis TaxID=31243 RepID=A0A914HJI6_GLORO
MPDPKFVRNPACRTQNLSGIRHAELKKGPESGIRGYIAGMDALKYGQCAALMGDMRWGTDGRDPSLLMQMDAMPLCLSATPSGDHRAPAGRRN